MFKICRWFKLQRSALLKCLHFTCCHLVLGDVQHTVWTFQDFLKTNQVQTNSASLPPPMAISHNIRNTCRWSEIVGFLFRMTSVTVCDGNTFLIFVYGFIHKVLNYSNWHLRVIFAARKHPPGEPTIRPALDSNGKEEIPFNRKKSAAA